MCFYVPMYVYVSMCCIRSPHIHVVLHSEPAPSAMTALHQFGAEMLRLSRGLEASAATKTPLKGYNNWHFYFKITCSFKILLIFSQFFTVFKDLLNTTPIRIVRTKHKLLLFSNRYLLVVGRIQPLLPLSKKNS